MSKTQWWQIVYGSILPAIFLTLNSEEGASYPHRNHHFPTNHQKSIKRSIQKPKRDVREERSLSSAGLSTRKRSRKRETLAFRSVELEFHGVITAITLSIFQIYLWTKHYYTLLEFWPIMYMRLQIPFQSKILTNSSSLN